MLANLATALLEHRSITTTEHRAKRLRPVVEKLITLGKRGDLHARRKVMTTIRDKGVVHELFTEIAPAMAERQGGYTRITKTAPRKGDNAPMAVIELVEALSAPAAPAPKAEETKTEEAEVEQTETASEAGDQPAEDTTSEQTAQAGETAQAEGDKSEDK